MKVLYALFIALTITPLACAVVCTITDDTRIPVRVDGELLIYNHERALGDFNCSCSNKEIPASIKEFCKKNKYNSSAPNTIEAALKAQKAKETLKGARQLVKAKAQLTLQEFQNNVIAIQDKASNNLNAISKKLDLLGQRAATRIQSGVESASQRINESRLGEAGRAANERLERAASAVEQSRVGKAAQRAAGRVDEFGRSAKRAFVE